MDAKKYREQKLQEIDEDRAIIRPAITAAFPSLFELARVLRDVNDIMPRRIETPFGDFIFHPASKALENLQEVSKELK